MQELYNVGLNDNDIKNMLDICPNINELTDMEILNNIEILKSMECDDRHIRNILISNPFYLDRTRDDILNLIKQLTETGITNLNLLFDTNPYLLNKDAYEIDEYIKKEINKGKELADIVDEIETDPYIIDEN